MSDVDRSAGGVAIVPVWTYTKHGQYNVRYIGIIQDPITGEIRQQQPGVPSSVTDIIVPAHLNPSPKAFAFVAWDQEGYASNPPVEIRVYWLNRSGEIFERAFSTTHGFGATWYDGVLRGRPGAAPYSGIAAITYKPPPSETPRPVRSWSVFFQSAETNHIRELVNDETTSGFMLKPLEPGSLPGIEGTQIAAAGDIYYQVEIPKLRWHIHGAGEHDTLPLEKYTYDHGAPISAAGSISSGSATVATVDKEGRLILCQYNEGSTWFPPLELVNAVPGRQVWATAHPPAQQRNRIDRAIGVSQNPEVVQEITFIGFRHNSHEEWQSFEV